MNQPDYDNLPEGGPQMKALKNLFDVEEARVAELREKYGDDHIMKIFTPKKKDYLKPLRK